MTLIDVSGISSEGFTGKTAIVTGGGSGIGLATARLLQSLGCNVVVGDLQLPKTESSDKSSNAADSKASQICYQRCDITNWSSLCALFDKAKSTFGRVDFVHANAAINDYGDPFFSLPSASPGGPLTEPDLRTIDINVKGTINTVALAMHHLKQNQKGSDGVAGSVVITASLAGYYATEGMPLYSAAKHALVGLLRALAPAAAPHGIALSLVAPGMTETAILGSLPGVSITSSSLPEDEKLAALEGLWEQLKSAGIPSQKPDAVAKAVCYLIASGKTAAGKGLCVHAGDVLDLEAEFAKSRPDWVKQNLGYLLKGDGAVWDLNETKVE